MIEKDDRTIDFIDRMKLIFDFNIVEIIDYWNADLCAIGLKRGDRMVYVSTCNSATLYDYDLEILNEQEPDKLNVIKEIRGISEDVLVHEIKSFFRLTEGDGLIVATKQ